MTYPDTVPNDSPSHETGFNAQHNLRIALGGLYREHVYKANLGYTTVYSVRPDTEIPRLVDTSEPGTPSLRIHGQEPGSFLFNLGRVTAAVQPVQGGKFEVLTALHLLDFDGYPDGFRLEKFVDVDFGQDPGAMHPDAMFDVMGSGEFTVYEVGYARFEGADNPGIELAHQLTGQVQQFAAGPVAA